jgi:hypothetical protein
LFGPTWTLAVAKKRPKDAEGVAAFVAAQGVGDGLDVGAGDLPQIVVAVRPAEQDRAGVVEVGPNGVGCAGARTWPAVTQGAGPVFGFPPDPRGHAVELAPKPVLERGDAIVVQQAQLVEHFGDPATVADSRGQLSEADLVLADMAGQQDDQALVDVLGEVTGPAAGLCQGLGGAAGPDEGGVVQIGVPVAVESGVLAAQVEGELELDCGPGLLSGMVCGVLGPPPSGSGFAQPDSSGDTVVVAVHAGEEQLLAADCAQELLGDRGLPGCSGVGEGLQPA